MRGLRHGHWYLLARAGYNRPGFSGLPEKVPNDKATNEVTVSPKEMTFTDVLAGEDLELGTSDWFVVDQQRIDRFAEATEDHQWIHVDPEKAAQSEVGSTIAHGFLVVSLLPKLFFEVVSFPEMDRMINFGIDKVRFLSPVLAGDAVRLRAKLISGRRRAGGILMRIRGEIFLRSSGRRAVVTEMLFLAFADGEAAQPPASS